MGSMCKVASSVAPQQEGPSFETRLGQGWLPPTIQNSEVRLICHSELSVGVNVRMSGCFSLYVSPGDLSRVYPAACLTSAGIGSSSM